MEMYIVLAISALMVVLFLLQKFPFGMVTMTCCVLLVLTGIVDVSKAFSGFCNQTVILVAPMLALSHALTKTSIVPIIRQKMDVMKGKSGILLVAFFFLIGAAFVQFIPATATLSIMVVFLATLDDTGDVTPYRVLLPLLGITCIWKGRLPIGMGATTFARFNALYEGILNNDAYLLQMLDPFKVALVPTIVLTIYCLVAWRVLPKGGVINKSALKEVKEEQRLEPWKEKLIYLVFVLVMLALVFNKFTGSLMYIAPAVGVLVLLYGKALSVPEAVKAMTADMVWMIAGVLIVADALGSSGAGDLIGSALLSVLGGQPSSLFVMFLFSATTIIMTTFLSNSACLNVLTPIAASVALAGGWDPRGIICIIAIANTLAIGFPSGAAECAVAYAAGGYNPGRVLKFTVPYIVLAIVSLALSANFLFPIYG